MPLQIRWKWIYTPYNTWLWVSYSTISYYHIILYYVTGPAKMDKLGTKIWLFFNFVVSYLMVYVFKLLKNFLPLINNATFYSLQKATTLYRTENIQYCVIRCVHVLWQLGPFLLTWSHTHNEGISYYQFKS